jgi:hypothetical protein
MGILDFIRRLREEAKEHETRRTAVRRLKGERASSRESRIALYESGLRALLEVDDGFVVYECAGREECYVQFAREEVPGGLWGEVAAVPVSEAGAVVLKDEGFEPPDDDYVNYHRGFEDADPSALAELVEAAFERALDCPYSYRVEVAKVDAH